MKVWCAQCGKECDKSPSHFNRAAKLGARMFCSMACHHESRRQYKATEQKKVEKRLYDMKYRADNLDALKAKKAARFQRDYDPVKAAVERKKNMHKHVEYCRTPEYKAWKQKYDEQYRAKREYGEFYEAFLILQGIEKEVASRCSKYEIALDNGTINKSQTRRRDYERAYSNQP